jgi:hypothetical protein
VVRSGGPFGSVREEPGLVEQRTLQRLWHLVGGDGLVACPDPQREAEGATSCGLACLTTLGGSQARL